MGFGRVLSLVSLLMVFLAESIILLHKFLFYQACLVTLQAKPDAVKLIIATLALLIASTSSILIVRLFVILDSLLCLQ